jgi:hypothetical protein
MRIGAAHRELDELIGGPSNPQKRTWGGPRRGSGRPKKPGKDQPLLAHRTRAFHGTQYPTHVILRAIEGTPSFRDERVQAMFQIVLEAQRDNPRYADRFQVVHASLQADRLHLVIEASDKKAMRSGVSGVTIAFAMRLNSILGRPNGKVWSDRYHSHELTTPSEVERTLAFVDPARSVAVSAARTWLLRAVDVRGYAA